MAAQHFYKLAAKEGAEPDSKWVKKMAKKAMAGVKDERAEEAKREKAADEHAASSRCYYKVTGPYQV